MTESCPNGHLYTPDNDIRDRGYGRRCGVCKRQANTRATRRKRGTHRKIIVQHDTRWQEQAACREADPALFDPLSKAEATECDNRATDLPRVREALLFCFRCTVRDACREWARASGEQGVLGGEYVSREARRKGAA